MANLNENEVEKVAGGADTPRDKKIGEIISKIKLPPRHKVKIFCHECRKSYDRWMPSDFYGILRCPKCRSRAVHIEHTDEVETKN